MMICVLIVLLQTLAFVAITILFSQMLTNVKISKVKKQLETNKPILAFFHPYADACGGGEKVLFQAISAL